MGILGSLSPVQRQLLMVGAPVAAGFAVVSTITKRRSEEPAPKATSTALPAMPGTDAIGVGQLASFESMITDAVTKLGLQVDALDLRTTQTTTVAAPPPPALSPIVEPTSAYIPPAPSAPPPPPPAEPAPASAPPPVWLNEGDQLPPASGTGQSYVTPDGYTFVYG